MSELIRREDVRRELQASFDGGAFRWQDGQDLLDRINAIPTASPWHRVEEEPKESRKQYVVWASKGYAYCDKWLGDRWLISSVAPETVTHWMPIEPPKEEENDNNKM